MALLQGARRAIRVRSAGGHGGAAPSGRRPSNNSFRRVQRRRARLPRPSDPSPARPPARPPARRPPGPLPQIAAAAPRPGTRALNLHEFQSMALMKGYGVPVPRGEVAHTPEAAEAAARRIAAGACEEEEERARSCMRASARAHGRYHTRRWYASEPSTCKLRMPARWRRS